MTKVTKTSVTLSTMEAHSDKPMEAVVQLILAAQHKAGFTDVTEQICLGAYKWAVKAGKAPGLITVKVRAKTKEVPAAKLLKEVGIKKNRFTGNVKPVAKPAPEKTPDEIARIKAANLAKMKQVTQKMSKMRHAVDGPGVDDFDANEARNEVDQMYKDLDSFEMPKFLTKDQVKSLV